jgi:TetR/AcrR family transcriptional regulator
MDVVSVEPQTPRVDARSASIPYDAAMAPSTNKRGRGRPTTGQSPVSDDQVLAKALAAFSTYGYDGVSLRTLTRDLGVSHNLLNQKYGSKLALWYAAVDHGFGPFVAALTEESDDAVDDLGRMRHFIETFAHYSADHPELFRLINAEATTSGERINHICDRYIMAVALKFAPLYQSLFAAGTLRGIHPATLFFAIAAGSGAMFSNYALTSRLFGAATLDPDKHAKRAEEFARLLLEGMLAPPDLTTGHGRT